MFLSRWKSGVACLLSEALMLALSGTPVVADTI